MAMEPEKKRKLINIGVGAVNAVLLAAVIFIFVRYSDNSRSAIYGQNIDNITNLNHSAAQAADSYLAYYTQRVKDKSSYIQNASMSLTQAQDYLFNSNSDNSDTFELIGTDCKGYLIQKDSSGNYISLDYMTNSSYPEIQTICQASSDATNLTASYVSEFNDAYSGYASFGVYTHLKIDTAYYTLFFIDKSENLIADIEKPGGYEGMATVLMDLNGNYIGP